MTGLQHGLGVQMTWFHILASTSLSVPQFPHLKSGDDKSTYLVGSHEDPG